MILIRVYGHNSELMINRMSEIRNMMLLHENGCGSELYASFQNGLAYQFLPGSTLTLETVVDPGMFPLVAEACAKIHWCFDCVDLQFIRQVLILIIAKYKVDVLGKDITQIFLC